MCMCVCVCMCADPARSKLLFFISMKMSSLPHPNETEHSPERSVFNVPKAIQDKDTVEYYIIYNDQINKKVGEYIPECNLTNIEKKFIEKIKKKIRFMRKIVKPNLELNQIDKSLLTTILTCSYKMHT